MVIYQSNPKDNKQNNNNISKDSKPNEPKTEIDPSLTIFKYGCIVIASLIAGNVIVKLTEEMKRSDKDSLLYSVALASIGFAFACK